MLGAKIGESDPAREAVMPQTNLERLGRRVSSLPPTLVRVEEKMAALAGANCPPELGPVMGEGDPRAPLALVGEAPGEREVAEGYPFAGPTGRLLDTLLVEVGMCRGDFWLTNVVKCRPVKDEKGRLSNRAPLAGELKAWLPLLIEELEVIGPRMLLCLGATAARALLGRDFRLTEQRGRWLDGPLSTRAMATFHPAYILHLESHDPQASHDALARLRLDLAEVSARLRPPVQPSSPGG
jgi:uracil-DNA glycosylase family 4